MVGPSIIYLLPILIAYTGGKLVYDVRGGVVGGFSVMGVIMATSDPIFIGDRRRGPDVPGRDDHGPAQRPVMKQLDALWSHKIKPGFEMLVNNFSAGILAALMAIGGMFLLAPVLRQVTDVARQRGRDPGRQRPAAADLDLHRAGEGALPQQRHQPRRADPARHPGGRGAGPVGAVPARGQPRPRPGPAAGLHVLRAGPGQGLGPGRVRSSSSSAASTRSTSRTC